MYYYNNELPPQQGWICPKCGRVNAPWLPTCGCVSSQTSGSSYLVETSSISRDSHEIAKDESQTCSVSGRPYTDCCNCEYFKCTADEPQTYGYMTTEQTADYHKMLNNVKHKVYGNVFENEPQTIIGERFPSYITENNAQVLDGWQTNPRTSTTAVENES